MTEKGKLYLKELENTQYSMLNEWKEIENKICIQKIFTSADSSLGSSSHATKKEGSSQQANYYWVLLKCALTDNYWINKAKIYQMWGKNISNVNEEFISRSIRGKTEVCLCCSISIALQCYHHISHADNQLAIFRKKS